MTYFLTIYSGPQKLDRGLSSEPLGNEGVVHGQKTETIQREI